jgi:hypothetical protein
MVIFSLTTTVGQEYQQHRNEFASARASLESLGGAARTASKTPGNVLITIRAFWGYSFP